MLPILCIAILPAWLVVTGRPEMVITPKQHLAATGGPNATEAPPAAAT